MDAVEEHAHLLPGASSEELAIQADFYLLQAMVAFVPALKDDAFREEEEWRLVAFPLSHAGSSAVKYRPCQRRGIVPYIAVPLVADKRGGLPVLEIFLGPTLEQEAAHATLRSYLTKLGYENAEALVKPSKIPYRG